MRVEVGIRENTLTLLANLLFNNLKLQQQFCELMGLPNLPGKVTVGSTLVGAQPQDAPVGIPQLQPLDTRPDNRQD